MATELGTRAGGCGRRGRAAAMAGALYNMDPQAWTSPFQKPRVIPTLPSRGMEPEPLASRALY